jgi:hypothetical protein
VKKLFIAALVVVGCVLTWMAVDSTRPPLIAKVGVTSKTIVITNGNDRAWPSVTVRLNNELDAPKLEQRDWAAGERRELDLADFTRTVSQTRFKPDFEKTGEIVIDASGFRLGTYR